MSIYSRKEIDLREQLANMYAGTAFEIAKSNKALLRRFRRDDDGKLIACDCQSALTREPDLDQYCQFCYSEGYYSDEEWIDVRRIMVSSSTVDFTKRDLYLKLGTANIQTVVYFLESKVVPTYYDRIVELKTDVDGNLVKPYIRTHIYRIQTLIDNRSDDGRVEFWTVHCSEKDTIKIKEDFVK